MGRKLRYEQIQANVKVEKVNVAFDPASGSRRNEPAVEVSESGYAKTNVEAAEDWMAYFEEQGIDSKQPWVTLSASTALGTVFMYAAQETDEGVVAVKFDEINRVYTTHYGAAFKQFPSLRPATKVEARFKPTLDKEGRPCLAVKIKGSPAKRAGAADLEVQIARAQAEAVKKAEKASLKKRLTAAKNGAAELNPPVEGQE